MAYSVPPEFWRTVLARVREEFPDVLILGEVIHGDYAAITAAGTLDAVTQYELWKGLWSSIADTNFWELDHAIGRHAEIAARTLPNIFIGNHDVDRIASKVGQDGEIIALALLMSLPGMPSIYYGDEQGFEALRGEGFAADDPVRPPLPATPAELSELGSWVLAEHKKLIGVRRRNQWLTHAEVEVLDKQNATISLRSRGEGGEEIQTDAWLEPTYGVRIRAGEEVLYEWQA